MDAFTEPDPTDRGKFLLSCIEEGDLAVSGAHAVETYLQMGEETGDDPTVAWPLMRKQHLGGSLVDALAAGRAFDDAYNIALDLGRLSSFYGTQAKTALLARGYAGPDGELLHMFDDNHLFTLPAEGEPTYVHSSDIHQFLTGLAGYGIDLTQPGEYHELLEHAEATELEGLMVQHLYSKIALAYHKGGHPELAAPFEELVTQHTVRGRLFANISRSVADTETLRAIAAEIDEQMRIAHTCDGSCVDPACAQRSGSQELGLTAARLYAQTGDTDRARGFLRYFDTDYYHPDERLETYVALYAAEGSPHDREAAMPLFNDSVGVVWEDRARPLAKLARADIAYGNTLPSLDAEGEVIPRVAWELPGMFGTPDTFEREAAAGNNPASDILGPYDERRQAYGKENRRLKQSQATGVLAIVLAEYGAPHTAHQLLGEISERADLIRTKMALARVYGAPELQHDS